MGTEVVDLENFFIGKPDRCERLISCLQYCLESDSANIRNGDHLYAVLEKGLFYRGMIQDFENLEFLSQIDTILNKFSEFEMLFVPKTQIDMCRVKSEIPGTCSAIINIVAQKCPVHKNLSCYILIDTKVNIYVVTVYEKQVVALLSISEDIQMHSVSSTGDVHQILSRDVSSFQPLADSSREEECIAAAHVAVVMCADDETIATMDSDARKLEATLQRLRKSEKVHSIKLIREHIASMKDCEPAAPGSRDADIASVKTREQSVTAAEFERAFPLEPGTTVRKSFAAMAASLDSPDKRPDSAPSRNPGNSVDLTINRLHSRRSLSPSQAHEGSPPVVAPTPSDVSPLERPVSVSAERNIDIRESLLNELLRSNESEDVASFGMRAYHAIRENVLGHQDWGTTGSTCIPENDGEEEEMEGSGAEDAEEEFDLLEELGGGGKMPSEMFYADGHANALDDSSINKTGLDGESTEEFVVVTNSQGEYVFSKLNSPSERSGFGGYVYKDYERSGLGHMDDSNAEGKVFDRKESRDHDRNSSTDRPRNWGSTKSPDEALLAVSQEYSRNTTSDIMVGREDLENTQTLNERTRMISPLKGTHTHFTNEKTPDPLESSNQFRHNYEMESGAGGVSDRRPVDEVGSDPLESSNYGKHNYETRKESGDGVQSDHRSIDEVGSDPLESSNYYKNNYETMKESVGGGMSDHRSVDDGGSDPLESSNYYKHNYETRKESGNGVQSDHRSVDEVGSDPLESSNQFRHNYETMRESVGGGVSDHQSIDEGGSDPLESSNYHKHNEETMRESVGGGVSDHRSVDDGGSDPLESSNYYKHNYETRKESGNGVQSDHRSVDEVGSDPLESSNQFRHNYETMRETVGGGGSDRRALVRGSASGFGGSMPSGDACFHDEIRALLSAEMESISQKKAERDSRRSLRRVELGRDIFFKVQASAKKRMADRNRATFVSEDRKKSIDVSHLSSAKDRVNAPPPPHWAGHGSDSDMRTEVLDHGSSHVARDRVAVGDKRPNGGEIQSVPRMEPTVEGLDAARNGSNLGLPRPPSADDIRYRSGTISGQEIVQKKIPGVSELRGIENEISPPPAGPASSSSTLPRGRGVVTGGSVAMTKPEINTGVSNAPESKHVQAPRELSDREKLIRERSRQRAVELWRKKQDTDSTRSEEHNDASTVATHQTHVTDRSAFGLNSVNEKEHTSNTRKPRKGEVLEIPIGPDDVGVQGKSATPSSIQDQENRRLRFEMMRKKKMEEAADREKIRQQSKERGMSAAGYAARELERRNLAKDPVRGVIKDRGVESSGCGKTRDIRDGDNGPPSVGSSRSRSKLNSRTSARPDGAEATGGTERSGYLTKHIDDTDMDRQIIELEREVANLDVGSVSSGNSGKPRSHSASHSSRRPTSEQLSTRAGRRDSGNHGTPRSVGQKRAMSAGRNRSVTNRRLSNAQQIKNALMNVCLAGSHQSVQREETLDAMDDIVAHIEKAESPSGYVQFVIVMHQSKMLSFKGLYIVDGHTGDITRLCGRGPRIIPTSVIAEYFKYESSTRSFKKLPTLTLANTCDAISVDPTKLKKLASKSEYIM
eukprot:CAMPEP_0185042642 /NCGR_PEP_ID=MMETSP1103-20130426/42465_1 /TAXON_ID=36769 /ORGANISM="Paraphysomonas bandaiensis, Strain Caron Lab Isolate" /LENGTH=1575 /DNA_ID=CAMNT_0027582743 /DNA_START=15 /DNA_END=4742 /DNA_ORIENTATION=-